jgi:hypothetical protein
MGRYPQTHEIVQDEAVEQAAEQVLIGERQPGPEAEEGVRRDAAPRKDSRQQRQPIRRARDVPVGQPRPQVASIRQPGFCIARTHRPAARREIDHERIDLFSLDHGQARLFFRCQWSPTPRGGIAEERSILGGVELAAKPGAPPPPVAER